MDRWQDGVVHRMDVDALRSLVTVASFAGVGRAAAALHLSQPTVSGHLRRLERDLGVRLVEKVGRSIAFTPAGDELARRAHRIVALHDEAVEAVSGRTDDAIVVGASDFATVPLLTAVSSVLRDRWPERPIRIRTHRSENIRQLVHEGRVDVALTFAAGTPDTVPVADVELGWYGAPGTDVDTGLVVFTKPCTLRDVMLGSGAGSGAAVTRECLDLLAVLDAVRAGVGITALPLGFGEVAGIERLPGLPSPRPMRLRMHAGPRVPPTVRTALVEALAAARHTAGGRQ